ncbi:MAG: Permease YjgP/YjgQ family protein [Chthoniobacteraceae bacterium]|nr:Permease YjgP/YjgQ family protein [Chthoniobacteraceae bacterium]
MPLRGRGANCAFANSAIRNQIPNPLKLLDRYILRAFLEPFFICFAGFIAIWLVFDLMGNLRDFLDASTSLKQIARFYATQIPDVIVISLPVALLLGSLFSLSRMSRSNEIISMLTAGRSVVRLLMPYFVVGLLASILSFGLNYEWAPHSAAIKKALLEQITKSKKRLDRGSVDGYLFRDRINDRTWYVRHLRENSLEMIGVHITQQDENSDITRKWYARLAVYQEKTKTWLLQRGMCVDFNTAGDIEKVDDFSTDARTITGWTETPWRILSSRLEPQNLSIPELHDYLKFNGDLPAGQLAAFKTYVHHRWALPLQCLIVLIMGAPLAIVFSRRGVVGGIASAVLLNSAMMLSTSLFLALGKGNRVSAAAAAWLPNAIFLFIGLTLLYFRSTNRDLPKFGFGQK